MKVLIGPYKGWWGPYQISDLLLKVGVSEYTADKVGDFLADKTFVPTLCDWVYKLRGPRVIKVRIDNYDTWGFDATLSPIIVPMLKQLKDTKQGSPHVDDDDVPPHMRYSQYDEETGEDRWVHYKWEWVVNEMIWAFEQLADPDRKGEDQFYHGTPEYSEEEVEDENYGLCYSIIQTNPDYWFDYEGFKAYNERIDNGTKLFGKYYRSLWD